MHSGEVRLRGPIVPQKSQILSRRDVYLSTGVIILSFSGIVGRNSSVGIPTRYGLDGPGIESRWGARSPHPSRPTLVPTQSPVQWVPDLSWG